MAIFGDDNDYGQMIVDFVMERLNDFNCTIVSGEEENIMDKLNAMSTLHMVRNGDLLDGLIAFMKNSKKNIVTSVLLDEYIDKQISNEQKKPTTLKKSSSALRRGEMKKVLGELSLSMFTKSNLNDMEDGDNDNDEQPDFPLDFQQQMNLSDKSVFGFSIKSKLTGSSYLPNPIGNDQNYHEDLVHHKILSDCFTTSYSYGHSNIAFDIYEIMPWLSDENGHESTNGLDEIDNDENRATILIGSVFPSDGLHLTFDNSTLFTGNAAFPLDFDQIEKISLYPGMQFTAKCVVDNSRTCRLKNIEEPLPLPMARIDYHHEKSHLKVFIAYGPFTTGNDISKFSKLIITAQKSQADALILIGPFVPNNVDIGEEDPDEFFEKLLEQISLAQTAKMRIYITPNCQTDLIALPYFPTPPIVIPTDNENVRNIENLVLLPDPAIFELGGVQFAISSSEILMHMCKREIYKSTNIENEDRIMRLTSHLFRSRSLYPLFPSDQNIPFSLPNSHEKLQLKAKPHILILPSLLQSTIKEVEGCLLINPGRYMRGNGSGTFVLLDIDLKSALNSSNISNTGLSISQFSEVSLLVS